MTHPAHLILLDLITLIISGEENYEAPHYAVCSVLLLLPLIRSFTRDALNYTSRHNEVEVIIHSVSNLMEGLQLALFNCPEQL
jgi:hypothetical protein